MVATASLALELGLVSARSILLLIVLLGSGAKTRRVPSSVPAKIHSSDVTVKAVIGPLFGSYLTMACKYEDNASAQASRAFLGEPLECLARSDFFLSLIAALLGALSAEKLLATGCVKSLNEPSCMVSSQHRLTD